MNSVYLVRHLSKLRHTQRKLQRKLRHTQRKLDKALVRIRELEEPIPPYHHMVLREGEPYDYSLREWIHLLYSSIEPITTFSNPLTKKTVNLLDSKVKKPIRMLIGLVFDVRKSGFQLLKETFSRDNVVVARDEIRVKRLYVIDKGFFEHDNEDFIALRRLLLSTFFEDIMDDLPLDMLKLLDSINNQPYYDEMLIRHHFALMNERGRRQFITQWWDIVDQLEEDEWNRYQNACGSLPHVNDWTTLIEDTGPLKPLFDFGKYSQEVTEQPRFFRHSIEHLLKHCRMDDTTLPPYYLYDDCANFLTAVFTESICSFPDLLSIWDVLSVMEPAKFFDY